MFAEIHLIYISTVQTCLSFLLLSSVSIGVFPRLSTRAVLKSRSQYFILSVEQYSDTDYVAGHKKKKKILQVRNLHTSTAQKVGIFLLMYM